MSENLTFVGDIEKWLPYSIDSLEKHLGTFICSNEHFTHEEAHPIKKNIAYSLQYIEFLHQVSNDINLTSVIWTQNAKSILVHGASVIEAIFSFLVKSKGFSNKTEWEKINTINTNQYELNGVTLKQEIIVYKKNEIKAPLTMTFDQLAKKVEAKKLLGPDFPIYAKIKPLRQLRNKIHIHDSGHSKDTDWYNFSEHELNLVNEVLYKVLTSGLFENSPVLEDIGGTSLLKFEFLRKVFHEEEF